MALCKYLTIETLEKILKGTIRLTQPSAFNDPFELLPELDISGLAKCENIKTKLSPNDKKCEPSIGELENDLKPEYCSDILLRRFRPIIDNSIGILCLTRNNASLLMWAHYADEYSGAMIEFNEDHVFFKGLFDVQYKKHRPKIDINTYMSDEDAVISIPGLCFKSIEWMYEEELRIVRSLSVCNKVGIDQRGFPIFVMNIPIDAIKSVVLGDRTNNDDQKKIYNIVKDTNISLYLATISSWGYKFRYDLIKANKPISELGPVICPGTGIIYLYE